MDSGKVLHMCMSEKMDVAKRAVASAELVAGYGMVGDAHAGNWHRQLSLLDEADIEQLRAEGLELAPGAFGENLVIEGMALDEIGVGSLLRVGPVELEITQIGKQGHNHCAIYFATGDCLMSRNALFARVIKSGRIEPGAVVKVEELVPRQTVQVAVVGRCGAEPTVKAIETLLEVGLGAHVAWRRSVDGSRMALAGVIDDLLARRVDLIVSVSGDGIDGERGMVSEKQDSTLVVHLTGDVSRVREQLSCELVALTGTIEVLRRERAVAPVVAFDARMAQRA